MNPAYLKQAWLVLILALVFGAALAGVQSAWGPKIQQNKDDEMMGAVPELVPGAVRGVPVDASGQPTDVASAFALKAVDAQGKRVGWVVKGVGDGYADRIELLVALDPPAERILGIEVLAQNETPGLGNKIKEPSFRERFAGRPTDMTLEATPRPEKANEIQAVSQATISSQSVCRIVNRTVRDAREALAGTSE